MKRGKAKSISVTAVAVVLTVTIMSLAEGKTARLEDEKKLSTETMMLNYDAKMPNGDRIAVDQFIKEFNVPAEKITALQAKSLDYGEIATILGIADKMSGGVNDQNISKVMDLRKSAPGWPLVADNLKVDLADVANTVSRIEDNVHKAIKSTGTGGQAAGKGAGGRTPTTSNGRDVGTSGSDY